jgi:hypothetical protein
MILCTCLRESTVYEGDRYTAAHNDSRDISSIDKNQNLSLMSSIDGGVANQSRILDWLALSEDSSAYSAENSNHPWLTS